MGKTPQVSTRFKIGHNGYTYYVYDNSIIDEDGEDNSTVAYDVTLGEAIVIAKYQEGRVCILAINDRNPWRV